MENKRESKFYGGSINLSKLDKLRFFRSSNGNVYLNIEVYVSEEVDQYGNHITIAQSKHKDVAESKRIYIGNARIFEKKQPEPMKEQEQDDFLNDLINGDQLGKSVDDLTW